MMHDTRNVFDPISKSNLNTFQLVKEQIRHDRYIYRV
jgi:hypothetical protein